MRNALGGAVRAALEWCGLARKTVPTELRLLILCGGCGGFVTGFVRTVRLPAVPLKFIDLPPFDPTGRLCNMLPGGGGIHIDFIVSVPGYHVETGTSFIQLGPVLLDPRLTVDQVAMMTHLLRAAGWTFAAGLASDWNARWERHSKCSAGHGHAVFVHPTTGDAPAPPVGAGGQMAYPTDPPPPPGDSDELEFSLGEDDEDDDEDEEEDGFDPGVKINYDSADYKAGYDDGHHDASQAIGRKKKRRLNRREPEDKESRDGTEAGPGTEGP